MNDYVFENTIGILSENIRRIFSFLPYETKKQIEEIRIRKNLPLSVTLKSKIYYVDKNGGVNKDFNTAYIVSDEEIEECYESICQGSVYAHTEEIKNGFITLENGCRVGVCGKFRRLRF